MAEQPPPPPDEPPAAGWTLAPESVPDPRTDDATDYLRANAGRYTHAALSSRLASAGHTPDAIEKAWAALDREDEARGRRDRRGQVSAVIGGAYLVTWLLLTLAWLSSNAPDPTPVFAVSGLLALVLLLPGALGFFLARGSRRLRRAGVGTAVAFAILPVLILLALAGTCVAIVPPFRPMA